MRAALHPPTSWISRVRAVSATQAACAMRMWMSVLCLLRAAMALPVKTPMALTSVSAREAMRAETVLSTPMTALLVRIFIIVYNSYFVLDSVCCRHI